jgi:hypothetical protein
VIDLVNGDYDAMWSGISGATIQSIFISSTSFLTPHFQAHRVDRTMIRAVCVERKVSTTHFDLRACRAQLDSVKGHGSLILPAIFCRNE